MTGPALTNCLKQSRPEVLVLYISGYTGDKLDGIPGLDREVALLQKPFPMSQLASKIRELLYEDSVTVPPA